MKRKCAILCHYLYVLAFDLTSVMYPLSACVRNVAYTKEMCGCMRTGIMSALIQRHVLRAILSVEWIVSHRQWLQLEAEEAHLRLLCSK